MINVVVVAWRRRGQVLVVFLLVMLLAAAVVAYGIRELGRWLMVEDPLQSARAIVVLGGHAPFRAMEAAAIYKQGLAPEIWITRGAQSDEEAALDRLGLKLFREEYYNRKVLERLGVPSGAIRELDEGVQNTAAEVRLIARELGRGGGERVILVTSKAHSRRVRVIWKRLADSSLRATVRYAVQDSYDPKRWWRHTRDALEVSREVFGLINVWAGFPLQPDRR